MVLVSLGKGGKKKEAEIANPSDSHREFFGIKQ